MFHGNNADKIHSHSVSACFNRQNSTLNLPITFYSARCKLYYWCKNHSRKFLIYYPCDIKLRNFFLYLCGALNWWYICFTLVCVNELSCTCDIECSWWTIIFLKCGCLEFWPMYWLSCRQVRNAERYNWSATQGVNEELILENLPEHLQRNIRRHLFEFVKKVRSIFVLLCSCVWSLVCQLVLLTMSNHKLHLYGFILITGS